MGKPLTTLGEQIAAKGADWRAQLRAAEVPRRPPPPSSRPDRGYIEQPEERRPEPPVSPRRRVETPTLDVPVALIRTTVTPHGEKPRSALDELLQEHAPEQLGSPPPAPIDPPILEQKPAPLEEAPVPKQKKKRKVTDKATQIAAVRRVMAGVSSASVARELGVHPSSISNWRRAHAAELKRAPTPQRSERTLVSPPSSRVEGELPPVPTARLEGLEAYLEALVERAVAKRVRAELRKLLGGDD